MPRRRRHREFKRRLRQAVTQAEVWAQKVEAEAALVSASADPLDDVFWREHERGDWCCYDCSPNHPDTLLWDAQEEINEHLNRSEA